MVKRKPQKPATITKGPTTKGAPVPPQRVKNRWKTWQLYSLVVLAVLFVAWFRPFSRDYIFAIASHYVIVASGVGSLAIAIYERFKGNLDERLFYLVSALIFVFAGFEAWQDEYSKTHPGVNLYIDEICIGKGPYSPYGTVLITADAANRGTPTILKDWRLEVKIPEAPPIIIPSPDYIDPDRPFEENQLDPGLPAVKLDASDALYNKTIPDPVTTGADIPGFLVFTVPRKTREQLDQQGATFILSCRSISEEVVTASWVIHGPHSRHVYTPGMKPPPH